jgi:hypothetical protein
MEEFDPFLPQQVQTGYEQCSNHLRKSNVKIPVLARLVHDGLLTTDDWNKASKLAQAMFKAEEEAQEKRRKEQEERRKEEMKPDSRIPVLWRSVRVQPGRLREYLQTYQSLPELLNYFEDLKARPLHYASIFNNQVPEVVQLLEFELAKRGIAENRKAKPAKNGKTANRPKQEYSR